MLKHTTPLLTALLLILPLALPGCASKKAQRAAEEQENYRAAIRPTVPPGRVRINVDRLQFDGGDGQVRTWASNYRNSKAEPVRIISNHNTGLVLYPCRVGLTSLLMMDREPPYPRLRNDQSVLLMPAIPSRIELLPSTPYTRMIEVPIYSTATKQAVGYRNERVTGSGLLVEVLNIEGRNVRLELTPYFVRAVDNSELMIEDLRTVVDLPNGQPVVMMSSTSGGNEMTRDLFSRPNGERREWALLVISADVGDDDEDVGDPLLPRRVSF